MAIYPFASAYAMAYTDSVFLALSIGAFLAAEKSRRPVAAVSSLALACLCRFQGIVLVLPLAIVLLRQDGWRPRPSLAWLLLGPAAALRVPRATSARSPGVPDRLPRRPGGLGTPGRLAVRVRARRSPRRSRLYQVALLVTLCATVFLLRLHAARSDADRVRVDPGPVHRWPEMASGSLEAVGRVTMLAFPYAWILANRRGFFASNVLAADVGRVVHDTRNPGLRRVLGALTPC